MRSCLRWCRCYHRGFSATQPVRRYEERAWIVGSDKEVWGGSCGNVSGIHRDITCSLMKYPSHPFHEMHRKEYVGTSGLAPAVWTRPMPPSVFNTKFNKQTNQKESKPNEQANVEIPCSFWARPRWQKALKQANRPAAPPASFIPKGSPFLKGAVHHGGLTPRITGMPSDALVYYADPTADPGKQVNFCRCAHPAQDGV